MVDISHLPYRLLCRRYGAELCFTPMLNAKRFVHYADYREKHITTHPDDRPLLVQFCGDDPDILLEGFLSFLFISFHVLFLEIIFF